MRKEARKIFESAWHRPMTHLNMSAVFAHLHELSETGYVRVDT